MSRAAAPGPAVVFDATDSSTDVKKRFHVFHFGQVSYVFYFPNVVFLFLKNVDKVQSGKQINKKHFQNNSNEIDL